MRVDGEAIADRLLDDLAQQVAAAGVAGCLATLVAADDELSHRQAALKHRAAERVGMAWRSERLPGTTTTSAVLDSLYAFASDHDVHGVFVHLPLPDGVDGDAVLAQLPPGKDVDGLRPDSPFVAASATATLDVLAEHHVPLQRICLLGNGSALHRGLERLLGPRADELVTIDPDDPEGMRLACGAAVLVTSAYRPGLVTADWVAPGAVVIDAASGDVDVESVEPRAGLLCASPGGIGPITVARLLMATHASAAGEVGTPST